MRWLRNNKNKFYAGKLGEPSGAEGSGIDIHAAIGKLPKPKKGWTSSPPVSPRFFSRSFARFIFRLRSTI